MRWERKEQELSCWRAWRASVSAGFQSELHGHRVWQHTARQGWVLEVFKTIPATDDEREVSLGYMTPSPKRKKGREKNRENEGERQGRERGREV